MVLHMSKARIDGYQAESGALRTWLLSSGAWLLAVWWLRNAKEVQLDSRIIVLIFFSARKSM